MAEAGDVLDEGQGHVYWSSRTRIGGKRKKNEWGNVLALGAKLQRQLTCRVLVVIVREVSRRRKGHT